jgi:hypothetical protein
MFARIAADATELARLPPKAAGEGRDEAPRARHRRLLAVADPQPKPLSQRAQRAALRKALGAPADESR